MNVLVFLALAVAGGADAATRLLIDGLLRAWVRVTYPLGTTLINVSGSLLLGLITGLAVTSVLPEQWHLILGGGFLGGYTTFSTASFETIRLAQDRRYVAALSNGLGMFVASAAASGLGLWIGSLL